MNENKELFEEMPVYKAVILLVVPTVISQLITVVYNMADTFFIGQVGDPDQVAAVSLCVPLFVLLTGMANLFGIGGSSLIARSLGERDLEKAKKVSAFSIWTAGMVSLLYGILVFVLRGYLLPAIGANEATYDFCSRYLVWAATFYFILLIIRRRESMALTITPRHYGLGNRIPSEVLLVGVLLDKKSYNPESFLQKSFAEKYSGL